MITELITIFKMKELHPDTRIRLITKLGRAINNEMRMNLTEEIVEELTVILTEERGNEYNK